MSEQRRRGATTGVYADFDDAEMMWVQALLDLPVPIVVTDEEPEILLFNPAMQELMALAPERVPEMEGHEVFRTEATHGTQTTTAERTMENETRIRDVEATLLNHDDEERLVKITSTPMYDADGELTGSVTALQDVTELRRKERRLQESQEQVAERLTDVISRLETVAGNVADNAADIEDRAVAQDDRLGEISAEMASLSANMEEIAATTDEVAETAASAREATRRGQEAGTDAESAAD
ncbi:PAS domain-containing protein, partial [Halorientalis sp.]|uniref:PAS domain-containing protein n=1 Tax=Halorientalis sp. TaxID=1931229 RepID=UPI00260F4BAB